MPSKRCPHCRKVIPASAFRAHRQAHRDQQRDRIQAKISERRRLSKSERQAILDRDGACVICGTTLELEVHHINEQWWDNRPQNLEVRCQTHNPRGTQQAKSI